MEDILGIAARSLIRHAVVGVLTGGTGNALILAGDIMDISDTMDAMDAMDTITEADSSSGGSDSQVHFGHSSDEAPEPEPPQQPQPSNDTGNNPNVPGYLHDKQTDRYYPSTHDYNQGNISGGQTYTELENAGKVPPQPSQPSQPPTFK